MMTNDGTVLAGKTPVEIVDELRAASPTIYRKNKPFMREVSRRIVIDVGKRVRWDTEDNFVADLLQIGFLCDEFSASDKTS